MHQAVWKLTALAGVIGIGLLVVMQAQRGIDDPLGTAPQSQIEGTAALGPSAPPAPGSKVVDASESGIGGPESFDLTEPTPAETKLSHDHKGPVADPLPFSTVGKGQSEPAPVTPIRPRTPPLLVADRQDASLPLDLDEPPESADNKLEANPSRSEVGSVPLEDSHTIAPPARAQSASPPLLTANERHSIDEHPQPYNRRQIPANNDRDSLLADEPSAESLSNISLAEADANESMPELDPPARVEGTKPQALIPASEASASTVEDLDDSIRLPSRAAPVTSEIKSPSARRGTTIVPEETVEQPEPVVSQPVRAAPRGKVFQPAAAAEDRRDSDEEFIERQPASAATATAPKLPPAADAISPAELESIPEESAPGPMPLAEPADLEPLVPTPAVTITDRSESVPAPALKKAPQAAAADLLDEPDWRIDRDRTADSVPLRSSASTSSPLTPSSTTLTDLPVREADVDVPLTELRPLVPAAPVAARTVTSAAAVPTARPTDPAAFLDREQERTVVVPPRVAIADNPRIAAAVSSAASVPSSTALAVDRALPSQSIRSPQMRLEKLIPTTVTMEEPLIYQIILRNDGPTTARQVVLSDRLPRNVRIDGTNPAAQFDGQSLIWNLGDVPSGDIRKLAVRLYPAQEGRFASVAGLTFSTELESQTEVRSRAPRLQFELVAPPRANVGTPVAFTYRVSNVGLTDATGVIVRNTLPSGLRHADGGELEYEVGTLPAGKSRVVQLELLAAAPGRTVNRAVVAADGGVSVPAEAIVEIVGSSLGLNRIGPKRVYFGKSGTFTNTITNLGQQTARRITVIEALPEGLDFVSASHQGQYDRARRQIRWQVEELAPRETLSVQSILKTNGRGDQTSQVEVMDASGIVTQTKGTTSGAGVTSLAILPAELPAPLAIGEEISYRIKIVNRGLEPATNVKLTVATPTGLSVTMTKGPSNGSGDARMVKFAAVSRLDAKAELIYELKLRADEEGQPRVQMQIECDQMLQPLRSEEGTTVIVPEE